MRGYESDIRPKNTATIVALRIPMRGYEEFLSLGWVNTIELRIPMRGYEIHATLMASRSSRVTNPHAGL